MAKYVALSEQEIMADLPNFVRDSKNMQGRGKLALASAVKIAIEKNNGSFVNQILEFFGSIDHKTLDMAILFVKENSPFEHKDYIKQGETVKRAGVRYRNKLHQEAYTGKTAEDIFQAMMNAQYVAQKPDRKKTVKRSNEDKLNAYIEGINKLLDADDTGELKKKIKTAWTFDEIQKAEDNYMAIEDLCATIEGMPGTVGVSDIARVYAAVENAMKHAA